MLNLGPTYENVMVFFEFSIILCFHPRGPNILLNIFISNNLYSSNLHYAFESMLHSCMSV